MLFAYELHGQRAGSVTSAKGDSRASNKPERDKCLDQDKHGLVKVSTRGFDPETLMHSVSEAGGRRGKGREGELVTFAVLRGGSYETYFESAILKIARAVPFPFSVQVNAAYFTKMLFIHAWTFIHSRYDPQVPTTGLDSAYEDAQMIQEGRKVQREERLLRPPARTSVGNVVTLCPPGSPEGDMVQPGERDRSRLPRLWFATNVVDHR